jgi:hypothetical protein
VRRRILSLSLIWLVMAAALARAQEAKPTEYQIKAAFLFNFAKFVQWPPSVFSSDNAPIVIGILGENPFGDNLARMVKNKTVDGRSLLVKEIVSVPEAVNCQILFISRSEENRLTEIIKTLNTSSVLTVADMDHFTVNGGMIRFVLDAAKIHFEINNEAATRAGLRISSKLLTLAVRPQR